MDNILNPKPMRDTFLESIYQEMQNDPQIFFVTADFGSPILDKIRQNCPERFINVGIAEQNLINVSSGLALEGYKVFSYAIAPFITMRCFEQIRINLALMSEVREINVNLIGVGAGYSYVVSGPTHQCYEDITLMRVIPNMRVISISDHVLAAKMPNFAISSKGPKYFRLDAQALPVIDDPVVNKINDGFYIKNNQGSICIIATGYMVHIALKAAQILSESNIKVGVVDIFDLSIFNEKKLKRLLIKYKGVVTMEEGFSGRGGLDSMINNFIQSNKLDLKILNIGVENKYRFEIGTRESLHEKVGIGINIVLKKIDVFYETLKSE